LLIAASITFSSIVALIPVDAASMIARVTDVVCTPSRR
jgi:hypothetical protein